MSQCTLSSKIQEGFKKAETLKVAEVDTLFSEYDRAVFEQPMCADPERYVAIAEQLQRHNKFDLTNLALAKALLVGPPGQLPYSRIAGVYSKMGFSEVPGIFKYVNYVQENQATKVAFHKKGAVEYWQALECENNSDNCRNELQSSQPVFLQNLKRQLLLSLYASYFNQVATYEDIYEWLVDPVTRGSWERDPKMVVDVLDYFIEKHKFILRDSGSSEKGNLLIVIRDLLKLTVPFRMGEPVHHPDLVVFFKPHRRENGIPLPGVKQGVAYYLIFLSRLSGGQLPGDALMIVLKDLSSNKGWASQVEALIKSRNTVPITAPGRKKK